MTSPASRRIERCHLAGSSQSCAGRDQGAEVADLVAKGRELLGHGTWAAGHDHRVQHVPGRDRLVRHGGVVLQQGAEIGIQQHRAQVVEVEGERVVGIGQIVLGLGVALGHEDAAGGAPYRRVGRAPGRLTALGIGFPVGLDVAGRREVRRDRNPAVRAGGARAAGARAHDRDGDGRVRFLVWLGHDTDTEIAAVGVLDLEIPVAPRKLVRRLLRPDLQDRLDRLLHHPGPVRRAVQLEHLEVAGRAAGADAEDEAALGQLVEHRGMGGDDRRVLLRQVDDAGTELDVLGALDQGREKDEGRGDLLRLVGVVLADIDLREAQLVRQDDRVLILAQDREVRSLGPVQRHHEHAEFHGSASRSRNPPALPRARGRRRLL